jgi:uncharacterized membrane protein YfcA
MTALNLAIDVVLGAAFGFLGGLFGIGGGIIAIPILGLVFGMSEQLAQGTALVMVVPNVMLGLWRYYQKRSLNVRYGVTLAICAAPMTYVGARFATGVPSSPLRVAFALFTIAIASYALWRTFGRGEHAVAQAPWYAISVLGAVAGGVSGIFGVGGSVFAVPIMAAFFGMTQAAAQSLGLALVAPGTLVGLATYAAAGDVDWISGAALGIGGLATVSLGVDMAHRLPDRTLKRIFALFLFASAAALLAHR